MLDSLPSRPLSVEEGNALAAQTEGDTRVTPMSIEEWEDGPAVTLLMAVNEVSGNVFVLGYAPDSEAWERIDSWPVTEWTEDDQRETVNSWARGKYGGDLLYGEFDAEAFVRGDQLN